jgi:integrase
VAGKVAIEMGRERTGSIIKLNGRFYARVTFTDSSGKRHDLRRRAIDRKEAKKIIKEILTDLETKGEKVVEVSKMTFNDLAEVYKETRMKPAEYRDDRKISGMRSLASASSHLSALVDYFRSMPLRSITVGKIEQFKQHRLSIPSKRGRDRSITSVNRELEFLRTMLQFAVCEGWIDKNPFGLSSTPLISRADEQKRTRILSREEERRILEVCGPETSGRHLYSLIIFALDTGCRKNEILTLLWSAIDFENRQIVIQALNTKTLTSRIVPLSSRLREELLRLYRDQRPDEKVFSHIKHIQQTWKAACKEAQIEGARFHDLRATFATRLIESGMPIEQVAKITGHSQLSILYSHYLRNTSETIERATDLLNRMNDHSREGQGGGADYVN